jgi:dienelactone hydrolase
MGYKEGPGRIIMKKILLWALAVIAALLVIASVGFVIWAETPLGPMPEALAALESDAQVTIETESWLSFKPTNQNPTTGLILYPGGRVDYRSYAPPARAIAEQGYLVVIPRMPLNLAVFSPGKAADVMAAYPEIDQWVVGGHSLGGAMAANFTNANPDVVDGLAFWAAYPAGSDDLSNRTDLPLISIYGTEDMGLEGIEASHPLLPAQTQWVVLEGGNHAQFGWYGPQPGDGVASISREEQQMEIIEATSTFLATLAR